MALKDSLSNTEYRQYLLALFTDPVRTERYRQSVLSSPDADPKLKAELTDMTYLEWLDKKSQPIIDAYHRAGGY
ncbi:hypothetical protein [Secundilactobacillus muriivasis]